VYCTNCGNELPPGATSCAGCGQRVPRFPAPAAVPNYLVHSIVTTVCCCLPFGIVALVYSAQVNSKLAAGDVAGAQASSKNAKIWAIVAFIAGIVVYIGSAAVVFWNA
jgi:Interferon-induced transmembrane protein/zinc-ribbon domain